MAEKSRLADLSGRLDAMSPLKVLGRGYAIAKNEMGVVASVEKATAGDPLDVMVADGVIRCEVKGKENRTWQ